ncbi:hypothetical protein JQ615_32760 [Bradyrhizobium jicamae]|uniref:Uncharacterized protein n=1 Tax=Bradyrhizobium jicamae TaxID=280332 RepID=A0ABS5FTH2_9BRAD|nr:hypothetical protein [Bradyrhizobium jicamae]MBR0800150.1 hypothetical protein [Bradyrhizobium jicamae]
MAQAFEFPRGNRLAYLGCFAIAAAVIAELPATLSRLPLPVRPSGWIGIPNMGPATRCRKHGSVAGLDPNPADSRPGNPLKVNRFRRI